MITPTMPDARTIALTKPNSGVTLVPEIDMDSVSGGMGPGMMYSP